MRWLSSVVAFYMLAALVWWMILLSQKTNENYTLQRQNNELYQKAYPNLPLAKTDANIKQEEKRQYMMIIGEGAVFGLALVLGIFFIQRAYRKEINATKQQSNFLLAVTHELKTPLTTMKMGLQTLRRPQLPESAKLEIIEDALSESERLENLINDLLLASKMSGSYDFKFNEVRIDLLLQEVIGHYKNKIHDKSIHHTIEPMLKTHGDAGALKIAFSNVIENALKYAPDSPLQLIAQFTEDQHILVTIADKGPGVPLDQRKLIFNRFYRVGSEDTRKTKGTGLGLYIVKKIIEGHQGSIDLKSNTPSGCIFEIKIPIKT